MVTARRVAAGARRVFRELAPGLLPSPARSTFKAEEVVVQVTHSRSEVVRFDMASRRVARSLGAFRRAVARGDVDRIFLLALAVGRALRAQAEVAHAPIASWLIH